MGAIIGMLVGKTIFGKVIGEKAARVIAIGGLILALVLMMGAAKCAYDASVIRDHEQKTEVKQAKREEKADDTLYRQKAKDQAAAQERKKEIEDATRNIPDRPTSDRQRIRACIELRNQGQDHPACRSALSQR